MTTAEQYRPPAGPTGDDNHLVIQPRCGVASIMKFVYLLIFFATAVLFLGKLTKEPSAFIGQSPGDAFDFMYAVYVTFCAFLVLHFVRMYLTLEMLEDPQTELHKACIPTIAAANNAGAKGTLVRVLSHIMRFLEQFFRGTLVSLVGFKAISLIGKIGAQGPTMQQLADIAPLTNPMSWLWMTWKFGVFNTDHPLGFVAYLFLIYCVLLLWDFSILAGGALAGSFADVWKEDRAFFWANCLGIALTLVVLTFAQRFDLRMLLGTLVGFYGLTFVADLSNNWRKYEECLFSSFMNFLRPYYGRRCPGGSGLNQVCNIAQNFDACPQKPAAMHLAAFFLFVLPGLLVLHLLVGPLYLLFFVLSLIILRVIMLALAIRGE